MDFISYVIVFILIFDFFLLVGFFVSQKNTRKNLDKKISNFFTSFQGSLENKILLRFENYQNNTVIKLKEEISTLNADLINKNNNFELKINDTLNQSINSLIKEFGLNNEKFISRYGELENKILSGLYSSSKEFSENVKLLNKELYENFEKLNLNLENKLREINDRVEERLSKGFEKTNETFKNIIERLSKIDEAQKKLDSLSTDIVSLQNVLNDKKSRGIFGEIQLANILNAIFGEKNDKIYKLQYQLSNGNIADSVLFLPDPVGKICIDSKFPLENYKKMTDTLFSEDQRKEFTKLFKQDIKKHIFDISKKYIIERETSEQAILFLPAEAIFAEINAHHSDLIEFSQKNKVWLCSPTTLMAVLTTIQVVLRNLEREKYTHIIQEEIIKLSEEFNRYKIRWDNLSKHIDTVHKDVKDIHNTTNKITNKFESIAKVDIKKEELP
jgi:DNA recombination protein RmuC